MYVWKTQEFGLRLKRADQHECGVQTQQCALALLKDHGFLSGRSEGAEARKNDELMGSELARNRDILQRIRGGWHAGGEIGVRCSAIDCGIGCACARRYK